MRGFSLLELLVSMSAALILTTTSMPMVLTSSDTYKLRNSAREIAAQCQNARFQAIADNVSYRLHLNGRSIELQKFSAGSYTTTSSFSLSGAVNVDSAWGSDPVFSPHGTVTPVSITLSNHSGRQVTVSMSLLGLVTIL